jgi:hypothetical protein
MCSKMRWVISFACLYGVFLSPCASGAAAVAIMRAISDPSYTRGYSRRVNSTPLTGERTSDKTPP